MDELSAHPTVTFRATLMFCKHHTCDTDGFAEFSRRVGCALDPLFRQFCKIDPPMIVVPPMKERSWINIPFPQAHEVSLFEVRSEKSARDRMVKSPIEPPDQAAIFE
ncbi:hypothetical protein A5906_05050 [Bradyrhizobium sacchari]|uniref:hypothetical protein n=1 Tax=Bradyrhizobium sacchari TaxID=1399419 RepID=UPI0009C86B6D|nr:hypothetical protein [Bradyrhizobium sacchari]OPY96054.1 hypothetical protein A5906_05050 [Bradyrhizobium sacchari]